MPTSQRLLAGAALAAALAVTPFAGADAQSAETAPSRTLLAALVPDNRLAIIDANQAKVIRRVQVKGVSGKLIGIDVRPFDRQLYGVDEGGNVVTIDTNTGKATIGVKLSQTLPAGVRASLDFNPAADRLRMIGSDGSNLRADVTTGTVLVDTPINFVLPNPFAGTTPEVIAGAYSNNVAGARATLLWDIDNATQALYLQIPPNSGVLNPVGNQLGIVPGDLGFDIETLADGRNRAWLINGRLLYRLGLVSGVAEAPRRIAGLAGPVTDLAVLPKPE